MFPRNEMITLNSHFFFPTVACCLSSNEEIAIEYRIASLAMSYRKKRRMTQSTCVSDYEYFSRPLGRIVRKPTPRLYEMLEYTFSLRSEIANLNELIDEDFAQRVCDRCETHPDDVRYIRNSHDGCIESFPVLEQLFQIYSFMITEEYRSRHNNATKHKLKMHMSRIFRKIIEIDSFRIRKPIYRLIDPIRNSYDINDTIVLGMKHLPKADWTFLIRYCSFCSIDDIVNETNLPQDAAVLVKEFMYGRNDTFVDVDSIWFLLEKVCSYTHSIDLYSRVHDLINLNSNVFKQKGTKHQTVLECLIKNWYINSSAIIVWEPIMKMIREAIITYPLFIKRQLTDKWDRKESLFHYLLPITFEQGIRYGPNAKNLLLHIIMLILKFCPDAQFSLDSNGNTALHLFTQAFAEHLVDNVMGTDGFQFCNSVVNCFRKPVCSLRNSDGLAPRDIASMMLPGSHDEISFIFSENQSNSYSFNS